MGFFSGLTTALSVVNPVALGANLLAGGLDYVAAEKDRASQEAMNNSQLLDARAANASSAALAQQNMAMQKEFAQNGISWRIADAAKNGISPLAALGAGEPGYSPVNQAFVQANLTAPRPGDSFRALGNMGQNVSRSLLATKSPYERTAEALALTRASRENDLLDVQIANAKLELAKHAAGPGIPLAYTNVLNADGTMTRVPTADAHTTQPFSGWSWAFDNKLVPALRDKEYSGSLPRGSGQFYNPE